MTLEEAWAEGYNVVMQVTTLPDGSFTVYASTPAAGEPDVRLVEWGASRVRRLFEHGPEPDGWRTEQLPDGSTRWQLCGRLVDMPPLEEMR